MSIGIKRSRNLGLHSSLFPRLASPIGRLSRVLEYGESATPYKKMMRMLLSELGILVLWVDISIICYKPAAYMGTDGTDIIRRPAPNQIGGLEKINDFHNSELSPPCEGKVGQVLAENIYDVVLSLQHWGSVLIPAKAQDISTSERVGNVSTHHHSLRLERSRNPAKCPLTMHGETPALRNG